MHRAAVGGANEDRQAAPHSERRCFHLLRRRSVGRHLVPRGVWLIVGSLAAEAPVVTQDPGCCANTNERHFLNGRNHALSLFLFLAS